MAFVPLTPVDALVVDVEVDVATLMPVFALDVVKLELVTSPEPSLPLNGALAGAT